MHRIILAYHHHTISSHNHIIIIIIIIIIRVRGVVPNGIFSPCALGLGGRQVVEIVLGASPSSPLGLDGQVCVAWLVWGGLVLWKLFSARRRCRPSVWVGRCVQVVRVSVRALRAVRASVQTLCDPLLHCMCSGRHGTRIIWVRLGWVAQCAGLGKICPATSHPSHPGAASRRAFQSRPPDTCIQHGPL